MLNRFPARGWLVAGAALLVALVAACGGATSEPVPASTGSADSSGASVAESTTASGSEGSADVVYQFPTGLAVTVPEGYTPPSDHVPETGTYLPANGKPTLVFVDAIW